VIPSRYDCHHEENVVSGNRISEPPTVTSRVLAILDSFTPGRSLSLVEISRRTGLAASTTHRLVSELRAWGALERDERLRYRIGPRLRELARLTESMTDRFDGTEG